MRKWIVRMLVVVAVVGAYALGQGLKASAEVPAAKDTKAQRKQFACGRADTMPKLVHWLNDGCDPDRDFWVKHEYVYGGTREQILYCCIEK